jgi:hypothetical protein
MSPISYARRQFPPDVIRHAVWLYLRFTLSYRDIEDLLAERGLDVSYETARRMSFIDRVRSHGLADRGTCLRGRAIIAERSDGFRHHA